MRLVLSSMFVLALAACGGSDDVVTAVDARRQDGATATIDAPPSSGNPLGQVCSMASPCPEGNTCVTLMGVGSQTMGYCSPPCTQGGTQCLDGYTGPATGGPQCALSMGAGMPATLCAIVCASGTDCPSGLSCIPVPGQPQPVSVCAAPA